MLRDASGAAVMTRPDLNEDFIDVLAAFAEHGVELVVVGAHAELPDNVVQIGLPPRRIDVLTSISGVSFDEAWGSRVPVQMGGVDVHVLGRDAMIRNKRTAARPKDLVDAESLERDQ